MISKTSPALMIDKHDVEQLLLKWAEVPQWIKAHISTRRPPHRYEGELTIEDENLVFRGRDIKEGKDFEEVIPLDSIIEVFFDFNEHLKVSTDPSFGIGGPVPLAVCYESQAGQQTAYLNTCLNQYPIHMLNSNEEWYETLKDIIDHNTQRELRRERYVGRVLVAT
jgi:hypothetical protein